MEKRFLKLAISVVLTIALLTLTGNYVINYIPIQTAYWILYFIASYSLIHRYERSKKTKDILPKEKD